MKLLDTFAKIGSIASSFSSVIKYILIAVIVIFAFDAGTCEGDKKVQEFKEKYEILQTEANEVKIFAESAQKKIIELTDDARSKDDSITALSAKVKSRDKQRDGLKEDLKDLEEELSEAKDAQEEVQVLDHIVSNLKTQLNVADSTNNDLQKLLQLERYKVTKLDSAVAAATVRGDRLQDVVDSLIKLPPPKTPKTWISKKTIGVIGFAGGVILGDYLARR